MDDGLITAVFRSVCAVGIAASLAIGGAEVVHRPAIRVGRALTVRTGETTTVRAMVTNRSHEPRCPVVKAAAQATDGTELRSATAVPPGGSKRLVPRGQAVYVATLTLTLRQYRERLKHFVEYAYSAPVC
jgi:hypothetical protein